MFVKLNDVCVKVAYIAKFRKENSTEIRFYYAIEPWQGVSYTVMTYPSEEKRNEAFEKYYEEFNKMK